MKMENTIKDYMGRFYRFSLNGTTVKLEKSSTQNFPEEKDWRIKFSRIYECISSVFVAGKTFIKCIYKDTIDLFCLETCNLILSCSKFATLAYPFAFNEAFVKVTEGKCQEIFDISGRLIVSENEVDVDVIFSGCSTFIKKTSRRSGKPSYWTIEGTLLSYC